MTQADVERRVRQTWRPEPRADLRARVLSAARVSEARITWSDRVWFSRAWRLAAAAAVVAAIAVESVPGTADRTPYAPSPQAIAEAQAIGDAGREIGLPSSFTAVLAQRAVAMHARAASTTRQQLPPDVMASAGDRR